MLEELLNDLGQRIGVGPLAPDEDGICTIAMGDGGAVHIGPDEGDPNYCLLVSNCGSAPDKGRTAFLRRLLEANFFHRDTGNAVIAFEPELDEALLIQRVRLDTLDGEGFCAAVTEFLAYQERWTERAAAAMAHAAAH